jgi:hypothetical protein
MRRRGGLKTMRSAVNLAVRAKRSLKRARARIADNDCAICQESMRDTCTTLPCKHKFHTECIHGWTQTGHYTCPLCRRRIPTSMRGTTRTFVLPPGSVMRDGTWWWPVRTLPNGNVVFENADGEREEF